MSATSKMLVIGGGFSGMASAIEFRKLGCEVDLVELDAGWRSYGAGISLGGARYSRWRRHYAASARKNFGRCNACRILFILVDGSFDPEIAKSLPGH